MRNFLIVLVTFGLMYAVLQTPAEPLKRATGEWKLIRAEGNEDASPLVTATAGDAENRPATATFIGSSTSQWTETANIRCIMSFCGGSAANKTFSYSVWGYSATNGMAEYICAGTGTLGAMEVIKYPHNRSTATAKYWADTLTITDATIWIRGVVAGDNAAADRCAKISFDCTGLAYLYVEITNADGSSGTEAGNISVYARFY